MEVRFSPLFFILIDLCENVFHEKLSRTPLVIFKDTCKKNHTNIECSRRDLNIAMVVYRFIFKHTQRTLSTCSTFKSKAGVGLLKTGVIWSCGLLLTITNFNMTNYSNLNTFI